MTVVDGIATSGLTSRLPRELRTLIQEPGTRTVLLSSSKDTNPKATILVLPEGASVPSLAIKVPLTDGAVSSISREAAALRDLHALGLGALTSTVPRCLDLVEHAGRVVLVSSAVTGTPLSVGYHAWRHTARPAAVLADFRLAGDWLAQLQEVRTGDGAPEEGVARWAARLAARWVEDPATPRVLDAVAEVADRLSAAASPQTPVHGDFWFGNVLRGDGHVSGVVDWESATTKGDPLRDLARFVLSYSLYLDRHTKPGFPVRGHLGLRAKRWGDGVRHALLGRGWYPDLVRDFLVAGLSRRGLPERLWFDVALAGVAEVAATSDHDDFARRHRDLVLDLFARRDEAVRR